MRGNKMRKAQAYSLIVLVVTIPLLLFVAYYITATQTLRYGLSEKIVADQQHQVAWSMERDFERAVDISTRRGLMTMSNDVVVNGEYLSDSIALLNELMENGTLSGEYSLIMQSNRLADWRDSILGIHTSFDVYLNYSNLQLQNYNGVRLNATVNMELNVSDMIGIARIDRQFTKTVLVSVEGLEDPVFSLETGGKIMRVIDEYPYPYLAEKVVTGTGNADCTGSLTFNASAPSPGKILVTTDASGVTGFLGVVAEAGNLPGAGVTCYIVSASDAVSRINSVVSRSNYTVLYLDNETRAAWSLPVSEAAEHGYYMNNFSSSGPDFFHRLEGNLSAMSNGMESIVNLPELSGAGVPTKQDQVSIDYLYFSEQIYNGYAVRGLPSWFRIDSTNAARYNLTELMIT